MLEMPEIVAEKCESLKKISVDILMYKSIG
jgi:hypothetical protein